MLRIARAALFAVLPAELLLAILLVSGVSLPVPVIVVAELAVVSVFVLEAVTAYRLFRAERRGGASRRAALLATFRSLGTRTGAQGHGVRAEGHGEPRPVDGATPQRRAARRHRRAVLEANRRRYCW